MSGLTQKFFVFVVHMNYGFHWQGRSVLRQLRDPGCFYLLVAPFSQHRVSMFAAE